GVTASGTEKTNQITFGTSLKKLISSKHQAGGAQLRSGLMALGNEQLAGTVVTQGLDIWAEGKLAQSDSGTASSDIGLLYIGTDYRFSPSFLVGFLAQVDWTNERDDTEGVSAEGTGWMVGPYVAARLHQNLLFDGRIAYGQAANKVSPFGTYADEFDSTRWLVKGQLTGDFNVGNSKLTPHVGLIYFEEHQQAYIDSQSVYISSQSVSLGRLTFGPKLITTVQNGESTITPHIAMTGIWDFDQAEIVDLTTGLVASSDTLRGRLEAGVSMTGPSGTTLSIDGFLDGIGAQDLNSYGGSMRLSLSLN
ncbi:MAG: autotransporter outer membrane beta-barrel domain-containing protein, partial [Pseudomonadota bacterium]